MSTIDPLVWSGFLTPRGPEQAWDLWQCLSRADGDILSHDAHIRLQLNTLFSSKLLHTLSRQMVLGTAFAFRQAEEAWAWQ